jgi:formate hydrogenlyase subunit 3/multisubunit Na+/H+ antiporter MnhD subunit
MYLPEEKVTTEGSTQKLTSSQPIFDEAPLTMLIPMGILAVLIIVLGLFNGEIVSSFIDPAISTRIR